jgi:alpha-D-ribose 1-methylphosphonate 5-triphosphate diphosphatase PhnM
LQSNATGQPLLFNEAVEIAGKTSNGGFIDLSTVAQVINDNKDLIQSGISTVGKVVDLGKTISDVSKSYKELEKIKELNKRNKKEEKEIVHIMTPDQEERFMKYMGRGFAKV